MKKNLILLTSICLFTTGVINAQMDNLSNMSAKWVMSNTRNAATDAADIVNYNPAGVVRLSDGLHINLSNQTMFRKPEHTFNLGAGEKTYGQDGTDPFLPMLYVSYKKNNWAISSGTYISGGGATANYPDGSINTNLLGYSLMTYINSTTGAGYTALSSQYLKASSYYITVPLIFSYSLSDKLSVAAGGKYIKGSNKTEAGVTLGSSMLGAPETAINVDYKENSTGFGGVIGIFYQPDDKLNLSIHYDTKVKLDFEASDNSGSYTLTADGVKNRRDLPAALCTGASYKVTDKLTAAADFNYFFQKNAEWGTITSPRDGKKYDASDAAGNCYTAGLGFSFDATDALQLNAGCKYTSFMYDDKELYYTKMGLFEVVKYNNLNFGLGASYKMSEKFQIDLGLGRTFWKDSEIRSLSANVPVNIQDKGYVVAIGVDISL
ncbi:MAG TPA: outer membrane protein transport protein [Bacteroidales bacterium]|mgnify:CR=1 FL=1|nr:outer membrane protein transport protein [Bacteroidales bacterium]